jgi:hypothetical protein
MTPPSFAIAILTASAAFAFKCFVNHELVWKDTGSVLIPAIWTACAIGSYCVLTAARALRREDIAKWNSWKPKLIGGVPKPPKPSALGVAIPATFACALIAAVFYGTLVLPRPVMRQATPRLGGQIDGVAAAPFGAKREDSVVTVKATVTNTGSPTVLNSFAVTVRTKDGRTIQAGGLLPAPNMPTSLYGDRGDKLMEFPYADFLPKKTENQPVPTNGAASGFFQAVVPGVQKQELMQAGVVVTLSFKDVFGTTATLSRTNTVKPMAFIEQTPMSRRTSRPSLAMPTIHEAFTTIQFIAGNNTVNYSIDELKRGKVQPFSKIGPEIPVWLYIRDNTVCVDASLYSRSGSLLLRCNIFDAVAPPGWDYNLTERAVEVINDKSSAVFQLLFVSRARISVNGIFQDGKHIYSVSHNGGISAWWSEFIAGNPSLPPKLPPLFKYPSWQHPGEYATQP